MDDPLCTPGSEPDDAEPSERYARQVLFPSIGRTGQRRLNRGRVVLIGAGALGASAAELLVRSGVGHLRIVDRDVVELSNLGRQALYTDVDAREARPKAVALSGHLTAVNPEVHLEARVAHVDASNVAEALDGADVIVDGTDNAETRYLLNDFAVKHGVPWVYGGAVGADGLSATIIPGLTPCLRCRFPDPPPPGSLATCDTAGILAPAATMIACIQVVEVLKLLVGAHDTLRSSLVSVSLWPFRVREIGAGEAPDPACPCCGGATYPFLEAGRLSRTVVFCGRNAVQVIPGSSVRLDLQEVATRLPAIFAVRATRHQLEIRADDVVVHLFADGRALISGTTEEARAHALYDRLIGS